MKQIVLCMAFLICFPATLHAQSVYTQMPDDPEAHFFTAADHGIVADGEHDVSDALQSAINNLKKEKNFGVLFIPEGKYRISKTIHVPKAIRIIGYGKNRPEFILGENTPGYQDEINYMFWFTSERVEEGQQPRDANPGTFYSAISNVDFRIERGNPTAVALGTRFAQHSFVSHSNFHIGDGHAGIHDLGNEIENLKFYGGDYGITTGRTSPGWPMMMIDLYFEGQRKAAVISRNAGMAIVSMHVKDAPVAVELQEGVSDRLYMEKSLFEQVGTGLVVGVEDEATNQINLVDILFKDVDVPIHFSPSGTSIAGKTNTYRINNFVYGLVMDDMSDASTYETVIDMEAVDQVPGKLDKVIPDLPPMESWVNVKDHGAVGDGRTDDTQAIQAALAQHKHVYLPTGWYRVTGTLQLNEGNALIGLHPYATQLVIHESEPDFSGFGAPAPLLESSAGGNDIVNGIGMNTGTYNNRAVGLKWMANEHSMINDVKFVGGHGHMAKPGEPSGYTHEMEEAWDNQYWSLWVTNNGGGTLKDIWTANTYASAGLYISDTSTPGNVYAMSIEHHMRQEARLNRVANWNFYAFQFEEENPEGVKAWTLDIANSSDLLFANIWMYRTIRVNTPRPWGVNVSNSQRIDFRNMRSWTQVLPLPERTVFDMDRNLIVYPGDFARVTVTGMEEADRKANPNSAAERLGFDYEFATGAVSDSQGNVYFCDFHGKRVYRWSVETNTVSIHADYPYKPLSLAVDTHDNLIVISRYDPQPGFEDDDQPQTIETLPDDQPYYSGWGNGGWAIVAYAMHPDRVDDMQPLQLVETNAVQHAERVIHPTHRWRSDFEEVATTLAETSLVAPDSVTILPYTFDLGRSVSLMGVSPNQSEPVYVTHEDDKTTYRFRVDDRGRLSDMRPFVKRGEYSNVYDRQGNVYLAEGEIVVLDEDGAEIKRIKLDERVHSMTWGGANQDELFVTTSTSLYRVRW